MSQAYEFTHYGNDYEGTAEQASHAIFDTYVVGPAYGSTYTSDLHVHRCET